MFCGGIYGECQQNSVFIFDTVKFPERKNKKDRIGYIIGNSDDTLTSIAALRNDGNDIIVGEFTDSELRLRLQNEGTHADGTGWKDEEYTRIVIYKREESNSLTGEVIAALKFQHSFDIRVYPDNEGTTLIPAEPETSVLHANSLTNSDYFKPGNIINQDGTCLNPEDLAVEGSSTENATEALRNQPAGGNETDDMGFKPVDATIEPWTVPFWSMDSILAQIHQTDLDSISRNYKDLLKLIREFPIFEHIGDQLCIRLMDIESIKDALRIFPDSFVKIVADYYAEKYQTVINSEIMIDQCASQDFAAGLQLLKKLHDEGFITCETVNTVDSLQKC